MCPNYGFECSDSLAVRLFTRITQSNQLGRKLLGPIIEERQNYLKEYGDQWADKPVSPPS